MEVDMKLITFLLLFNLVLPSILAQKETALPVEFYFITEYAPASPIITCTLTAQSQCWGDTIQSYPPSSEDYYLTDDYDNSVYVPSANNLG
jgi:hypothetical protein